MESNQKTMERSTSEDVERAIRQQDRIYNQPIVSHFYTKRLKKVIGLAPLDYDSRVLDVGYGYGVLLHELSKTLPASNLWGINIEDEQHDKTVTLFSTEPGLREVNLISGDVLEHDFSQRFDVIFATSTFEHIKDLDRLGVRMNELLAPGGRLIVCSPNENRLYEAGRLIFGYRMPHDHYHTSDEITQGLQRHLDLERTTYFPFSARLYKIDIFRPR